MASRHPKYLVLIDSIVSSDGGHTAAVREEYWVETPTGKQTAAKIASNYVREKYRETLISDHVFRVVAEEDWGKLYFPVINQKKVDQQVVV